MWLFLTVTSQVTLQHTRVSQGLLKLLRDWFGFSDSCHICAKGQNPQYQLEKQHHLSSSKWSMFAWLSLNYPKHSGYLLFVFKKVSVQCPQQAALQLAYKPPQHGAQVLSRMSHHHCYFLRLAASFQSMPQEWCSISFLWQCSVPTRESASDKLDRIDPTQPM